MKFPDIKETIARSLKEQYDNIYNDIYRSKQAGNFHFKCFLDLQDEYRV